MATSLHSMVESGVAPAPKDEPVFKALDAGGEKPKTDFGALADALKKMGARNNKKDSAHVQAIHDACEGLAEAVHCFEHAEKTVPTGNLAKAGARHSSKDLARIGSAHKIAIELGAVCKGTSMMDTAGEEDNAAEAEESEEAPAEEENETEE